MNTKQKEEFRAASKNFYKDKTLKRIEAFKLKVGSDADLSIVNGRVIPSVEKLLERVDWDYLSDAIPVHFHGDLQFDNVLSTRNTKAKHPFTLLDWRQDFGGITYAGDLYYDLAKLYGGVTMSYPLIKEGMFSFTQSDTSVDYKFFLKSDLVEAKEEIEDFISRKGYDLKKIQILTAIIFLNMAPLHNDPFDRMLYHMGRTMLYKSQI